MRAVAIVMLVAVLASGCVTLPAYRADDATVSGRFDLPRAEASPLAGALVVSEVSLDPASAALLKADEEGLLLGQLRQAFGKSLGNFGYAAPFEAGDPLPVSASLSLNSREASDQTTVVESRLTITPDDAEHPLAQCAAYGGVAEFTALQYKRAGQGQLAFMLVAGAALAAASSASNYPDYSYAANSYYTYFGIRQSANAEAQTLGANAIRDDANVGEGVPPGPGAQTAISFAAMHAIQLTYAAYIAELDNRRDCGAAETPAAETPAAE